MQSALDQAQAATEQFYSTLQTKIVTAATIDTSAGDIYDAGEAANQALKKVSMQSYDALTAAVAQRLSQLTARRGEARIGITLGGIVDRENERAGRFAETREPLREP